MRARLLAAALVLAPAAGVAAQARPGIVVGTTPDLPGRGSVAWLRVAQDSGPHDSLVGVAGATEGEPLHFETRRVGGYRALLPLPLEGGDSVMVELWL
jgi:hypothetical protein